MNFVDVSIIIINYNTKELTLNCIESIIDKTYDVTYEIIVVDNASIDGSIELFSNDLRIKFIPSQVNLGFGKGNNLGVEHANGKYVFLLNSDTILVNNAVKHFYDYFEDNLNGNIGVLGCVLSDIYYEEGMSYTYFKSISRSIKLALNKFINKLFHISHKTSKMPLDEVFEVDVVLGADMFMPLILYRDLEGFDPDFFLYGEEVEFQKRIANIGLKRLLIRKPKIIHLEGGSRDSKSKKLSYNTIYLLQKGNLIYIKKHYNKLYYLVFILVQAITWYPWVLFDKRFSNEQKKSLKRLLIG
ncbi:hypothetical protein EL17_21155 [Anditalea andensis]|uniref:Glycosyltransferase 2-like domain-containing protein n=1 Tax=Anditalea andensis TaxID=1048983 RepID=A0A074KPE8_9BACT|nr:hypothetical protein EL17_21155 [Anditalea andensis]